MWARDDYTARYSLEALEEAQRQRVAAMQASKAVRSFVSSPSPSRGIKSPPNVVLPSYKPIV